MDQSGRKTGGKKTMGRPHDGSHGLVVAAMERSSMMVPTGFAGCREKGE